MRARTPIRIIFLVFIFLMVMTYVGLFIHGAVGTISAIVVTALVAKLWSKSCTTRTYLLWCVGTVTVVTVVIVLAA